MIWQITRAVLACSLALYSFSAWIDGQLVNSIAASIVVAVICLYRSSTKVADHRQVQQSASSCLNYSQKNGLVAQRALPSSTIHLPAHLSTNFETKYVQNYEMPVVSLPTEPLSANKPNQAPAAAKPEATKVIPQQTVWTVWREPQKDQAPAPADAKPEAKVVPQPQPARPTRWNEPPVAAASVRPVSPPIYQPEPPMTRTATRSKYLVNSTEWLYVRPNVDYVYHYTSIQNAIEILRYKVIFATNSRIHRYGHGVFATRIGPHEPTDLLLYNNYRGNPKYQDKVQCAFALPTSALSVVPIFDRRDFYPRDVWRINHDVRLDNIEAYLVLR